MSGAACWFGQTSIDGPDGKRVALVTQTQLVLPARGTPTE
jgi:hypothetical protein